MLQDVMVCRRLPGGKLEVVATERLTVSLDEARMVVLASYGEQVYDLQGNIYGAYIVLD